MQELFLPVHGHVALYSEEIAIIDHPSFQRLRRVRQLGFAHIVFPGGCHTRLEHSIGAVHVAQTIIDHVNSNHSAFRQTHNTGDWEIISISTDIGKLIRLGALLHDIGHLPFGHTLEDELNHLRSHDGPERLVAVGNTRYDHYDLDAIFGSIEKPEGGWSLRELVNCLYQNIANSLSLKLEPFSIVSAIISKAPKQAGTEKEAWQKTANELEPITQSPNLPRHRGQYNLCGFFGLPFSRLVSSREATL